MKSTRDPGPASGRLVGATLRPRELEAEFRAANLREDGRTAAIVVGGFLVLTLPFMANDLVFVPDMERLQAILLGRVIHLASGIAVVVAGLRARSHSALDVSVLVNAMFGAAFTILLQAARPPDYYLPVTLNAVGALLFFGVIPNRFSFQVIGGATVAGASLVWLAAFRTAPPWPVALLIHVTLAIVVLAGCFVSWRLHRHRRLQFLAVKDARASRSRYEELAESLGDGFVTVAPDGTILEFNESFRAMLGYAAEELRGMKYQRFTPERWHAEETVRIEGLLAGRGGTLQYEKEYRRKDGSVFPVEIRASMRRSEGGPDHLWAIVRDITEARATREKLAAASRLATMSTLVAGLAHEVNNPLGAAVVSHDFAAREVEALRDALRGPTPPAPLEQASRLDEVAGALGDALAGEQRVAAIVKDLALLGRPGGQRSRLSLDALVDGGLRIVPAGLLARATIRVERMGAPAVTASEAQITQVVANLVANAIQARRDTGPATVVVRTGPGEAGGSRLEVEDEGVGMPPDVLRRMFDPFYTTRQVGQGMGLGLSICHAIVTAHGGTIAATSAPGLGSTFRVDLPAEAPVP